jgi:protein-S-isoprenylcysteine O-methyltransferase Ste14
LDDSNHEDGLVDFGLEMALYRFIGIQFEVSMLIGFRGNKYKGYQEKGSMLISFAR